jgi:hypothetical protein
MTITFPVVLYGRKTWTLTLWEEHRLRVFENSVLRKIFGPQRDEVMGGWRKLHIMRSCMICTFFQVKLIKGDDAGRECSANGGEQDRVYVIDRKARGKKTIRKIKM